MENNIKKEYICITETFCCTPETNATLSVNYTTVKTFLVQAKNREIFPSVGYKTTEVDWRLAVVSQDQFCH